jgi:hypothetical protein
MPDIPAPEFFYHRHRYILHHFLPMYQYVLHLDADSLVLNLSRSLSPYLDTASKQHIYLHLHENGEVTAAAYLIRNSAISRCFLNYWSNISPPHADRYTSTSISLTHTLMPPSQNSFLSRTSHLHNPPHTTTTTTKIQSSNTTYMDSTSTYEVPNYDNGDLVTGLINLLGPRIYNHCITTFAQYITPTEMKSYTNIYHETIVKCWALLLPTLPNRVERIAPYLRIFHPREGFWRTHARLGRFGGWWDELFGSCYSSSDVIGHGWKALARSFWPVGEGGVFTTQLDHTAQLSNHSSPHSDQSQINYNARLSSSYSIPSLHLITNQAICNLTNIHMSNGHVSRCQWLSPTQELHLARKYCMYWSPVCKTHSKVDHNVSSSPGWCVGSVCSKCLGRNSTCSRCRDTDATKDDYSRDGNRLMISRTAVAALLMRDAGGVPYGVEHEGWWVQQLCSACPKKSVYAYNN